MTIFNLVTLSPVILLFGVTSLFAFLRLRDPILNLSITLIVAIFIATSILIFTDRSDNLKLLMGYTPTVMLMWTLVFIGNILANKLAEEMGETTESIILFFGNFELIADQIFTADSIKTALSEEARAIFPTIRNSPFALVVIAINIIGILSENKREENNE